MVDEIQSELYKFLKQLKGVDTISIEKIVTPDPRINKPAILTNEALKAYGWKNMVAELGIGVKKAAVIFNALGEKVTEEEVADYMKEVSKIKAETKKKTTTGVEGISTKTTIQPPSTETTPSATTPVVGKRMSLEEMQKLVKKVQPDITEMTTEGMLKGGGEAQVRLKAGGKVRVTLTREQQKFGKMIVTEDMDKFMTTFASSYKTMITDIKNSIMASIDTYVPTGARSHVRQWINLLESKIEGRAPKYSVQTMNDPKQFKEVLEPMLDDVIKRALQEYNSLALKSALTEYKNTGVVKEPQFIMNTIILYKLYVDAVGSGWDGQKSNGQLGISAIDKEEFYDRMGKISKEYKDPDEKGSGGTEEGFYAVKRTFSAYQTGVAVLLAGLPGSGKTYFSKAACNKLTDNVWETLSFTRLNITGGLEPSDLLGEWDYQAQILALEASKIQVSRGEILGEQLTEEKLKELKENIFTIEFFKFGPLALCMIQGVPILIDEVNRGSPDIQNTLLQAIDENEVVIPLIGRIKATPGFFVMATINEEDVGTTELGQAFMRRVNYIGFAEPRNYVERIKSEFPTIGETLAVQIAKVVEKIKAKTTVSSEISPSSVNAWAREIINIWGPEEALNRKRILMTLGTLFKNKADIDLVAKEIVDNDLLATDMAGNALITQQDDKKKKKTT